jgi:hypothetical protein
MSKESKQLKTFAQTEREKIRDHFAKRAGEASIPNPLDPESMRTWDEYVKEVGQ